MHFMELMESYGGSKGVRVTIVEDGLWGNLAPHAGPQENASHHLDQIRRP